MPAIMRNIPATTADALNGLNFNVQNRPALISLWASTDDEGDVISFLVNSLSFLEDAEVNLELTSGTVQTNADQILFREGVPAGQYRLPAIVTADTKFLLVIEPV